MPIRSRKKDIKSTMPQTFSSRHDPCSTQESLEGAWVEQLLVASYSYHTSTPSSSFSSTSSRRSNPEKIHKSPTLLYESQKTFQEINRQHPELCSQLFKDHEFSLHHKISQSDINTAFNLWIKAGQPDGDFKNAIRICEQCTNAFGLQALLNAPFNLELGPLSKYRISDPGDCFDPSFYSDGEITPRSRAMYSVLTKKQRKKPIPIFETIGLAFLAAYDAHVNELHLLDSELSTPILSQWEQQADGKWKRTPT